MCPLQPEQHFHLPPHPIPPGSHRALALGTLFFSFFFFLMLIQTESKSTNIYRASILYQELSVWGDKDCHSRVM